VASYLGGTSEEQRGYTDNPDNIMNLAQAMLAGRSLEAFLNEKRSQEAKNRVRKSKTIAEHTPKQIYLSCQFERLIPKVDGEMPTKDNERT
jgi:hypothetical protein